jgi:hypothetical protein
MEMHRQCVLDRNGATQVSWIPASFADEGRYLRLKEDGKWTDGWRVTKAFPADVPSAVIAKNERNFVNHRKATDV